MSRREDYFRALRRQPAAQLIWAPNFDHWYEVNSARGTLPEEYRGMPRNDIVRAVDGTIWRRVNLVRQVFDPAVTVETEDFGETLRDAVSHAGGGIAHRAPASVRFHARVVPD